MRILSIFLFFVVSAPLLAAIKVGQPVPDLQWEDEHGQIVRLNDDDRRGKIRVLLYNAGWCAPCVKEFHDLGAQLASFEGQPVVFLSLSAEGYSHDEDEPGHVADRTFLKTWHERSGIPATSQFVFAASPGDFGARFNPPSLPNVAIVDRDGRLAYARRAPGVAAIVAEVKRMLAKTNE